MSANAANLARWVKARRDELDLTQMEVWMAGGPSNTTLTKIENAEMDGLTRTTARKLDAALQWEPGSARRVWEGGSPNRILSPGLSGRESATLREAIGLADDIDDATRRRLLAVLDGESDAS